MQVVSSFLCAGCLQTDSVHAASYWTGVCTYCVHTYKSARAQNDIVNVKGAQRGRGEWGVVVIGQKTCHAPKWGGLILHDMAQSTNWFTFSQVPSPQPVKCLFQYQASPLNKTLYLKVRSNRITSTALWICANISCQLLQPDVSHVAVWTTKVHGAHILPCLYVIWWLTDKQRSFCWSTLKIDSLWLDGGSWTGRLSLAGGCRRPRAGRMRVRGCQTVSVKVEDTERDGAVC